MNVVLAYRGRYQVREALDLETLAAVLRNGGHDVSLVYDADVFGVTDNVLQVRGTDVSMQTVRQLQHAIDERGLPKKAALFSGLKILSGTDLTAAVGNLGCAVSWLLGEKDALVPVELAAVLKTLSTTADIQVISGAGHAPFVSHPLDFVNALLKTADGVR